MVFLLVGVDFHHINPEEKELEWGKLRARSWESIKKELDKDAAENLQRFKSLIFSSVSRGGDYARRKTSRPVLI